MDSYYLSKAYVHLCGLIWNRLGLLLLLATLFCLLQCTFCAALELIIHEETFMVLGLYTVYIGKISRWLIHLVYALKLDYFAV